MTSYCYRITAGAGVSNRPIRLSRMTTSSTRTVEISRLPQNYCSNHHLRSRKIIRAAAAVVEAVGPCGDGEDKAAAAAAGPCSYAVENLSSLTREEEEEKSESDQDRTAEIESEEENEEKRMDQSQKVKVVVAAAVTVVMGVGNRVLYKLALVPLKHYPFFLAQLATFGYFFSFLFFL